MDDDDDDSRAAASVLDGVVNTICRLPGDVRDRDLMAANLVLVDFRIEDWQQRDELNTPSLKPQNGLALVATLRSNLSDAVTRSPTAFALRSGRLSDVSGGYQYDGREHVLAKLYDLEWVFSKSSASEPFSRQVKCLADAVGRLPHPWPKVERRRAALSRLLALSSKLTWMHAALEDLDRAVPPEDIHSGTSRGLAVVRWLLHEVLPYSGPLLDSRYLAARLFLKPDVFAPMVAKGSRAGIRRTLSPFEYRGVLSGFLGPRWWRAGIEHWLWARTKGRPLEKGTIVEALRKLVTDDAAFSDLNHPVVSVDDQFRPTDKLIELSGAVQLRPDDWPRFADAAWVSVDEVKHNAALLARIDPRDRKRAHEDASAPVQP